jgi:hypothetical protein
MEEILARRFAPFDFYAIPSFPNDVPSMDEWGDYLPRFREREEKGRRIFLGVQLEI